MRNTPDYKVIRSKRQTLSITVDREGNVIVRAPLSLPDDRIEKFVSEKSDWIEKYSRTARARVGERSARLSKPPMELPLFGGMCPVDNVQPYGYTGGKFHLPEVWLLKSCCHICAGSTAPLPRARLLHAHVSLPTEWALR